VSDGKLEVGFIFPAAFSHFFSEAQPAKPVICR
jgi:hypothetical protein